jgi:tRNA U34 5-methylaminomethyl-2-thiouridine-forming methyltransferase MnmC
LAVLTAFGANGCSFFQILLPYEATFARSNTAKMLDIIPARTADGSLTLFVPALEEHYHSVHGARQESAHVFISYGLLPLMEKAVESPAPSLRLLEIGLGTGLNALLTAEAAQAGNARISYTALETVPLPTELTDPLAAAYYPADVTIWGEIFRRLHAGPWNQAFALTPSFTMLKLLRGLETLHLGESPLSAGSFDLIYFDAFAPQKQPELWTAAIFRMLFEATVPGGTLVTYCAQGQFRRDLRAAGWEVEKLPGPPGKREMTRARRPPIAVE